MIIQETNPLEMAGLYIVYDTLSPLDETGCRQGLSHVIEHMIGKAMTPISSKIHEYGISDDYCTNFELVKASFTGTAEAMEKMIPAIIQQILFRDAAQFTQEDFESERRAIINELMQSSADVFHETIHRSHRESFGIYGPEGTLDNVRVYTFDEFQKDYNRVVPHPSRIVYVGPRQIQFPEIEFSEQVPFKPISTKTCNDSAPKIPETADKNEYNIVVFTGVEPIVGNRDYAAMNLAIHMLTGNDEGILFDKLRTKEGLVYSCFGEMLPLRCSAIQYFYTVITSENTNKVMSLMGEILENPEHYLSEDLFAHAKKYYENTLKATQILRFCNCQNLIRQGMITEKHDILDINYPELIATARKYLAPGKFRLFVG